MTATTYALADLLIPTPRPVRVEHDACYSEIGIRSHGRGIFHKTPVTGADLGSKKVFWIEPGDFVLNIVFAWEGAVAIAGLSEAGMIGSHRFPTYRVRDDRADPRYLLHFFGTREGLALLLRVSPGGAGRNRTLGRAQFLREQLRLPPVDDQHGLVAQLEAVSAAVDDTLALRDAAMAELQALKLALVAGRDGPSEAKLIKVRDAVDWVRSAETVDPTTTYTFAGAKSFGKGLFRAETRSGDQFHYRQVFRLQPGDFVYPKLMAWEGAFGVVPHDLAGCVVSPEFQVFRVKEGVVIPEVLDTYFRSRICLSAVRQASSGTNVRRRRLHPERFLELQIPHPDPNEQRALQEVCRWETSLREETRKQQDQLRSLKASALRVAFASLGA